MSTTLAIQALELAAYGDKITGIGMLKRPGNQPSRIRGPLPATAAKRRRGQRLETSPDSHRRLREDTCSGPLCYLLCAVHCVAGEAPAISGPCLPADLLQTTVGEWPLGGRGRGRHWEAKGTAQVVASVPAWAAPGIGMTRKRCSRGGSGNFSATGDSHCTSPVESLSRQRQRG